MSRLFINDYLKQLDLIKKISGSSRETIVREAFKDLLKAWGKQNGLVFIAEFPLKTATKTNITVDGALLHELRMPLGYWEAKDADDDLDAEVSKKFRKGYPQDNIIFSDDTLAVLWQNRQEVLRCEMTDIEALSKLLKLFFSFERPEIAGFRAAVEQFKTDLPAVLQALREMIEREHIRNPGFRAAETKFLAHAQEAINPGLTDADVREMLIQHILTEEIFAKVFDDSDFHQHNNVARELYALEGAFFIGALKKQTLKGLETYYAAIRSAAAQIASHGEKQTFLKVIYENFYKVYNAKAADRLGVVYTPNEIVRFMIAGADWLTEKHFGKNLIDRDVDILDPATGTGTFISELLEHFRGQPAKLKHKYLHELHANEVAILPYYVANLNIESTYAAISGSYEEFPSLCFVDTLDNVANQFSPGGLTTNLSLFGSVSEENVARIKRQNGKRISVIIGNPPYYANQANENDNNKSREYPDIDKRIKHTYIAASTAQKTKLYDMYARFFRWASDRLNENGVIAFVSNNSFIDARTFDGFRKVLTQEFNEIWVVNLKGNARTSGERRRQEGGNIFDDQIRVGVAIWFCVKKKGVHGCKIMYEAVRDYAKSGEKLDFVSNKPLRERQFHLIQPDAKNNWINLADNDFDTLIPLARKEAKAAKTAAKEGAIFKLYSLGVVSARDDWVYDFSSSAVSSKAKEFIRLYEAERDRWEQGVQSQRTNDFVSRKIKWTSELEAHMSKGTKLEFDIDRIRIAMYRPFVSQHTYFAQVITHRTYQQNLIFPITGNWDNQILAVNLGAKDFNVLAANKLVDYHFNGDSFCFPQFCIDDKSGNRADNITDWALKQFTARYQPATGSGKGARKINKESIFHYCYAVLHDPGYREKYAQNLKREFPRIPFYADFWQWAAWGEALMALHIGYEQVAPFTLTRTDTPDDKARAAGLSPKALLRADPDTGTITLDSETTLRGIPADAWLYKLGNRSALDWVLDQYKEKKPKDPTIREKFDTYRFADYKEKVIDLLMRVTTVSVETVRITQEMRAGSR